ncbi:type 4a pilus biogenesis protein PilO [Halomonas sp. Bachu 37]|uniref:type 4a pilus biogenesis protein PilO n=1 Tax=Halomonas kashgarensis TaxID=3084920 RepID=UPI003217357C
MNLKLEWRRLRQVDWRELDVKEAGGWPFLLKVLCCILALLLSLALMNWWVIGERRDALESAERREVELLADYRGKAAEASYLPGMLEQLSTLELQMEQLRAMLPTDAEVPSLLDSISDAAVDNRLTIENIRLRAPVTQQYYIEQPFDIQVRGGYHEIAAFISDMADLSRIVTQHDFTLAPVAQTGGELRLSMLARTYNYRPVSDRAEEEVQ